MELAQAPQGRGSSPDQHGKLFQTADLPQGTSSQQASGLWPSPAGQARALKRQELRTSASQLQELSDRLLYEATEGWPSLKGVEEGTTDKKSTASELDPAVLHEPSFIAPHNLDHMSEHLSGHLPSSADEAPALARGEAERTTKGEDHLAPGSDLVSDGGSDSKHSQPDVDIVN